MRRVLLFLSLALQAVGLRAQVPLSGTVTDPSGAPVAWATVVWHDENDQRGAVTDETGAFRIERPERPGMLTLRSVGYRTAERPLAADESELGVLVLEEESVEVGAVTVTAGRTERRGDRFILHVGDTPAAAGKNGRELLREAPGVWVDDSGVRINGTGGVRLYLDDRELHLSPEEQSAWLHTLAAADVAAVEVVPQAGAEQAADTQGGIVRIRTRHAALRSTQRQADINLGLNTTQSDRMSRCLATLSAEATAGRWSLYASASGDFTPRDRSRFAEVREYFRPSEEYASLSEGNTRRRCGRGMAGLRWSPGRGHRLGIEVEYTASDDRLASTVQTRMGELLSASGYLQQQDGERLTATLSYTWQLDTAGSVLKLLADYTRDRAESDNDYATRYLPQRDTLYFSRSSARHALWSIDLSLEKRLFGRCILHTGIRYAGNRTHDCSAYAAQSAGERVLLPAYGYTLDCAEHTAAAYASFSAEAGRWSLSAGLRGEYTRIVGPGSDYAAPSPTSPSAAPSTKCGTGCSSPNMAATSNAPLSPT